MKEDTSLYAAENPNPVSTEEMLRSFREAKAKMDGITRDMNRSLGELAELECPTCHRKVTAVNNGFGDTLVVCPHIYEELKRRIPPADPVSGAGCSVMVQPWAHNLAGLAIEVAPEEPRRW